MTTNNQKITYNMIRTFTENYDHQDSDGYLFDILNGNIDVEKMKSFILKNNNETIVRDIDEIYK